MSPYFIALPQTVLNIGVVSVILLSLILKNEKPTPNILFLLNLSFTDLVQAVLLFIVVKYFNFNEYDSGNPDVFAEQATNGCHNKSTIICFLYSQSMLATIIVTLDRYLTISFPFKHKDLMTKRIVLLLVILSWLLPIIFAASIGPVIGASIPNQETINSTHMASSIPKTFLVCLIMVVLCSTYGAYFKIIFAHWSLKRKHSVMRKSISSMGYNSSTNTIKQIYENVERLGRYIKDSKYVIVLLIVFTLCWFPWVVAYTVDISYHSLDLHRHQIQVHCGAYNSSIVSKGKYEPNTYLCIRELVQSEVEECNVIFPAGSTASDECGILYDVLHERLFESIQLLISWFVALNSFFNPIVYAIWFKPFRRLLKEVLNKIRIKLFPEKSEFSWLKQSQVTTIQTS